MNTNFKKINVLFGIFLLSSSFVVDRTVMVKNNSESEICAQTIKYSTSNFVGPNGEEISAPTELTINPITKIITLESAPPDQEKVLFDTQIESVDCSFSEKLVSGKADYQGYIMQLDGSKTPVKLVLEAKNGVVNLTSYDGEQNMGIRATFNKWEIITN